MSYTMLQFDFILFFYTEKVVKFVNVLRPTTMAILLKQ